MPTLLPTPETLNRRSYTLKVFINEVMTKPCRSSYNLLSYTLLRAVYGYHSSILLHDISNYSIIWCVVVRQVYNIGVPIIGRGFWGPLYYNYDKEPPKIVEVIFQSPILAV